MKRLVALVFAAVLVLGSLAPAQALDIQASMTWELGIGWEDNTAFRDAKQGGHEDSFRAAQRIRPQFEFITSETLRAVLEFEIGVMYWGEKDSGGQIDADSTTAYIRRSYLQWSPMDKLELRMGMQGLALPSATFGNPVLDTDVAGVSASYSFNDNVALTVFWLRPFDRSYDSADQTDGKNSLDEMDMFGFALPITADSFSLTPWAMYARTGNDSGYWQYRAETDRISDRTDPDYNLLKGSSNMWWAGAAFELKVLDPFIIKLDGVYGRSTSSGSNAPEFSGWLVAGLFEFNTESMWGNPGLLGWYGSGDDGDDYADGKHGKYGRMPVVSTDRAGFAPTAYGFAGSAGCMADGIISNSGVGTWGIGLQLDGMSFIDKLSHTIRVAYIRGTNDEDIIKRGGFTREDPPWAVMGDAVYMTKKDHAWEVDFLTSYEVNDNFTIFLEAAYVNLDLSSNVWKDDHKTTDAWKAQVLFEFAF